MSETKKLYAYIDESGQDTNGALFVVGVIVLEEERDTVLKELERIEQESGKRNIKWRKARHRMRETYMRYIAQSPIFKNTLFFEIFGESKEYLEMTSFTAAKAIIKKADDREYSVTVYVDGLSKADVVNFGKELKALNIKRRKVKGVRKDENNALIRLADALCGLVRDAREGTPVAVELMSILQKKKAITAL
jgi:hypothetical protein